MRATRPRTYAAPMLPALTREQARAHDRHCIETLGIPGIVLMENAARGCAELAMRMLPRGRAGRVCVACGPGQNGGDGYAIARHLANAGHAVTLACLGEPRPGTDAATMRDIARAMRLPMRPLEDERPLPTCDLVIDALFGTGLDRPLAGRELETLRAVNASGAPVLSVDLPSGMDCDTGAALPECVQATLTATMAAPKAGFAAPGAAASLGRLEIVSIGGPAPAAHG